MAKKIVKKVAKKAVKKVVKKTAKKLPAKKASKKVAKKAPLKKSLPKKQSASVIKSPSLKPGDLAPGFTLPDQNGKLVSLKDFIGMNVVVYFYPRALTPGCTVQACELRNSYSKLENLNIIVLGISPDSPKKLKNFEDKKELNFTLLSDEDHKVIESYGSWGPKKFMGREFDGVLRQSFFIDSHGKILHVMHKVDTKTHHQVILDFFKNLK